jgi:hypothetical protein
MTLITILITAIISAAAMYFYLRRNQVSPTKSSQICNDYSNYQPSTLQTGLVGDMISIYRKKQHKTITTNLLPEDAHTIWFDLETIKKFIFHFEKNVQKNGISNAEKLGLRIYYASYPKKETWKNEQYQELTGFLGNPLTEKYEEKHTLVMLPTININGKNTDFNPLNIDTYTTGLPIYKRPNSDIDTFVDQSVAAKVSVMALTADSSKRNSTGSQTQTVTTGGTMAQNHGALYPPFSVDGAAFP